MIAATLQPSKLLAVRLLCVAVSGLMLSACAVIRPQQPPSDELPPPPPVVAAAKGQSGGVFSPQIPWTLLSDSRAFRPGDVLTVVLQETTQASKSADTSFGKQSSISVSPTMIAGSTVDTDVSLKGDHEFKGNSTSTQQNALQGAVTVIVQEVLPNGLLRVGGEKSLYLNQGEEFLRVVGYVRSQDIDSDNRVSSQRIANARIAYSGRGALTDASSAGWLVRFFASPWMPF
ncbi:MAG TPA: flagellar basal body L-ring protein FlgH [Steroidobacteraceae bacterium]